MRSSVLRPAHCSRPALLDLPLLLLLIGLPFAVKFFARQSGAGASKLSPDALHPGHKLGIAFLIARDLLVGALCVMLRSREGGRDRFGACLHAMHQRVAPLREEGKVPLSQGAICLLERGASLVLLQAQSKQ